MDAQLRALAEPRRREILQLVWSQELPAGEIAAHFDVTRPAISQHLTVLKHADLIVERRAGTRRLYRARREQVAAVLAFSAWLGGHGALAWCAVEQAWDDEPGNVLAGLVAHALEQAIPPATWTPFDLASLRLSG